DAVQRQEKDGIVDRNGVESLLEVGPDRRPRRRVIELERPLVPEQFRDRDVMHRTVRRLEPAERRAECAGHVLRRGNGDMPLIRASAEEDDRGQVFYTLSRAPARDLARNCRIWNLHARSLQLYP